MFSLILAVFTFVSPSRYSGPKPVELTGDMRADWTNHAATAQALVGERPPDTHILRQWHKLGVKVYKRIAYDPECAPEYVRRRAGFLAVHENVDGIWLADEGKYPESWRQAFDEAQKDVDVALYAKGLAEKAMTMKAVNNKIWIEGRRVMWLFRFSDFEFENLDTLRLEYVCYAKRLEQLLNEKPRELSLEIAKPALATRTKVVPLAGQHPKRFKASVEKAKLELSEGLVFSSSYRGFGFTISSRQPYKGSYPGGKGSFRLWMSDGSGGYMPYEFKIDLTPIALTNRAPTDCWGLWFQEDRWDHGVNQLYSTPWTWRLVPNPRASYSCAYPQLRPPFRFTAAKDGKGWSMTIEFSWLAVWGHWPSVRNGSMDVWYVSMDALPGVPASASRIEWARGREINYRKIAANIAPKAISERYASQKGRVNVFHHWYEDRLYGFAKTKTPTYQRYDAESDKVFWERVVEPILEDNRNLEDITRVTKDRDDHEIPAKLTKMDEATKQAVYKSLGKLFTINDRVTLARRDYILQRHAGGIPPEPPPKPPVEGAAAIKAPDIDNDDDAIQLDEKEF